MMKRRNDLEEHQLKKERKVRKDQNLRRDRLRLLHHFAEAGRLCSLPVLLGHPADPLGLFGRRLIRVGAA